MPVFHLTLAYLRKGQAAGYVGDTRFKGVGLTIPSISFSPHTGDRVEIPLKMLDGTATHTDQFGQVKPPELQSDDSGVYTEDDQMATVSRQIKLSQGWQERLASLQAEAGKAGNPALENGVNVTLSDGRTLSNVKVFDGQTLEFDKELSMSGVVITDMTPGERPQADDQAVETPSKSVNYPTTSAEQQARDAANLAADKSQQNAPYTDASVATADPQDGDGYAMTEDEVKASADKAKKPYGDVEYADPGYQKDGKKRYPINTPEHIRAAWSYINKSNNCSEYTPAQCSHIKSKIVSAWKKHIDPKGPPSAKASVDLVAVQASLDAINAILRRGGLTVNTTSAGVSSSNPISSPMNLAELQSSLASVKTIEELPAAVANVAAFADAIAKASEKMVQERTAAQDAAKAAQASVEQIKADLDKLTKTHNEMVASQQAVAAQAKFDEHMAAVASTFDLDDEVRAEIVDEVKAAVTDEAFAKWLASAKKKMKGFVKKKAGDKKDDSSDDNDDDDAKAAKAAKLALASAAANIVDAPVVHDFAATASLAEKMKETFANNISVGGVKVSELNKKAKK